MSVIARNIQQASAGANATKDAVIGTAIQENVGGANATGAGGLTIAQFGTHDPDFYGVMWGQSSSGRNIYVHNLTSSAGADYPSWSNNQENNQYFQAGYEFANCLWHNASQALIIVHNPSNASYRPSMSRITYGGSSFSFQSPQNISSSSSQYIGEDYTTQLQRAYSPPAAGHANGYIHIGADSNNNVRGYAFTVGANGNLSQRNSGTNLGFTARSSSVNFIYVPDVDCMYVSYRGRFDYKAYIRKISYNWSNNSFTVGSEFQLQNYAGDFTPNLAYNATTKVLWAKFSINGQVYKVAGLRAATVNQSNGDLSWGSTTDIRTDGTFTTSSGSWNGYGGSKRAPSNRNMFYEQVCGDVILLHESGLLQLRSNGNTITEQINLGSGGIPSNASLHSQGVAYCPLNNKSILVYQYASGSTYYNRALYIVGQIG